MPLCVDENGMQQRKNFNHDWRMYEKNVWYLHDGMDQRECNSQVFSTDLAMSPEER